MPYDLFTPEIQTLSDALLTLFDSHLVVASRWHVSGRGEVRGRGGFLGFGCGLFGLFIASEASAFHLIGSPIVIKLGCFLHPGFFCCGPSVPVYVLNLSSDGSSNAILVVLDFDDLICQFCLD